LFDRKGAGPEAAATAPGARKTVSVGKQERWSSKPLQPTRQAIRAELIGSTCCTCAGISAHGSAPVLKLCRKLLAAGADPHRPLGAYRGATLALIVGAIGEAARLEITSNGRGFVRVEGVRTAPPMRKSVAAASPARKSGTAGTCGRTRQREGLP
jgi:hypothetical protein